MLFFVLKIHNLISSSYTAKNMPSKKSAGPRKIIKSRDNGVNLRGKSNNESAVL